MEELEKNETSTQAEENTVSLVSAQALADALAKIEAYTPTTWVDNSSPDIDAEHLNKPEQAIKRVTDALNSTVDVIKDLQSQVTKNAGDISTVNNNLSQKFAAKDISNGSLNQITTTGFYFGSNITEVTPYIKSHKWCLINAYVSGNSASIFVIAGDAMALSIYRNGDGIYSYYPIATKSDLDLKLNNTSIFVGNGEDFGQAIKKAGIVQLNKVGFFICNNPSNSPLGNGFIILAHNLGYWSNHPMYIKIDGSSISCGTLNCSDYTHITKD